MEHSSLKVLIINFIAVNLCFINYFALIEYFTTYMYKRIEIHRSAVKFRILTDPRR
jgi:hypothetical protein